jgi:hypothetical protein
MEDAMIIDCDTCSARDVHCHDCVITVLLGTPTPRVEIDSDEQIALVRLAAAGLVPPLRLVTEPTASRFGSARRDTRGIA